MPLTQEFYIFPEDLFRLGNSSGPRLDHVRDQDIDLDTINGVPMIRVNNRGVSLYTAKGIKSGGVSGWAWKLKKNTALPATLKLHQDRPEHFMICPTKQMTLFEYKALLAELALKAEKAFKVEKAQ